MELNPPGQYADDRNLHARQRLWQSQVPSFDIVAWVLDLAALMPGARVLDAGCGNVKYLRALRELRRVLAPGGTCVAVTTGPQHLRSLRDLIERAVRLRTPDWRIAEVVRRQVQAVIDTAGEFRSAGDLAAFVCR